jgi:hypothetical protein
LFVEVTAMVGSADRRRLNFVGQRRIAEEQDEATGHVLIARILARISQKARQLADYCAPVIVAITVPKNEGVQRRSYQWQREELDVRQLAGAVTVMLPLVQQVSGVMLSLWDVEPAIARSGIRLATVSVVERPVQQLAYPRVRLLILNPAARFPLQEPQTIAMKRLQPH